MIQIDKKGRVLKGDFLGHYVKIERAGPNTEGFLIITSPDIDFEHGFDDWVQDFARLEKYFEESGWEIEWIE
jgi:hypothetical protein